MKRKCLHFQIDCPLNKYDLFIWDVIIVALGSNYTYLKVMNLDPLST